MHERSGALPLYNPDDEALSGKRVGQEFGFKGQVLADLTRRSILTKPDARSGEKPRYRRGDCAAVRRGILSGRIVLSEYAKADFVSTPKPCDSEPEAVEQPPLLAQVNAAPEPIVEVIPTIIPDPWADLAVALEPFGEIALHPALKDAPGSTVLTRIGSAEAIKLDQVRTLIAAASALYEARA